MATEAEYGEMWAQDATAMYSYAASSASASTFSSLTPPPQTTNPGGVGGQAGAVAQVTATQAATKAQSTSAHVMSSVPQALQGLSTPGSSPNAGLTQAAIGTEASVGTSGASAPVSALSSLTSASGKSFTKTASAGTAAASGVATGSGSVLTGGEGAAFTAFGLGSDAAGLGADGAGLGADGGGIGMDAYGVTLDLEGAGSILGAEGVPGFQSPEALGGMGLGQLGPVAGLGQGASASMGHGASLGTLSVPPAWGNAASSVTPLPALDANTVPAGWGATPSAGSGSGISKLPLGGMVGREAEGAVHRIGFRPSLIPRSPVAG